MGITKELGESPNLIWHLNNMNGHEFEDWIYNILTKIMKNYFDLGATIVPTPGSGDNGKDIIVKSPINLYNIFYQNFSMKNKDSMTIYVECKSTDSPKLKFDKIISNVIRAKYDHIDYFVLVTNATIIPDTYHKIDMELKQHNIDFVLIDQYLLAKTIYEMGMKEKESIPLSKKKIDFCCQYQVQPFQDDEDKTVFDVPMLFRNYTPQNHTVTVRLFTDENWEMDQKNHSIVLPPYGTGIRKFTFKHISYDGIDELKLYIKNQDNESIVPIEGINYKEVFIPQFTGERHQQILYHLHKVIPEQRSLTIYYLWGETGIGKSRIVIELFKLLSGRNYDLKKINLSAKVNDPTTLIGDFLYAKKYITENFENLYDMMKAVSHEFRNALIVLEDFHYVTLDFVEQLKLIDALNIPISIIICGRNDYSAGSLNYFSFIQWTLENKKENSWEVKPFLSAETEKFIRIMINGIPMEVLSAIHAKSMNNPLYIVQYIEYLLDINMVSLQNRNTVGILNIDTFPTKNSIPDKINTIYKKRLSHLIDIHGENAHLSILLLLTIFGNEISISLINDYFDLENDEIEELVKRRFIKYGKNKSILFYHESMFLFFKKTLDEKKRYQLLIAKQIIENKNIFLKSLSDFEIGKMYIWLHKNTEAKFYFSNGANAVKKISNHSNINIDIKLYDYLYHIYELYYKSNLEIAKNALIIRIYMSLHHFAPMTAVYDCEKISSLIAKSKFILSDDTFMNTINSLKAHALLNAGHLSDGELVLKELLSEYFVNPVKFNLSALFDIVDRLASVYIKYNCYHLASNYVEWEMKIAEQIQKESGEKSLLAIAHRTRSKLYFFQNPVECLKSLEFVMNMPDCESSERIYYSNKLSLYIYKMYYDECCNWADFNKDIEEIRKKAAEKSFDRVLVRSDLLLSVCAVKLAENRIDLAAARKIVEKGINESIRLGIPGYIWQFYNLLAIIDTRLEYDIHSLNQLFETIYAQLFRQNLLYIGNQELCFCNLLAISNIGSFFCSNFPESRFKEKMSVISYAGGNSSCNYNCADAQCNYICSKDNKYLNEQYHLAEKKGLLFVKETPSYKDLSSIKLLKDDVTQFFIPIS